MTRFSPLLAVICAGFVTPWAYADGPRVAVRQQAGWTVCETDNFAVWGTISPTETEATAQRCEAVCDELRRVWLETSSRPQWSSKCIIVLHANAADYAAAVSQPGTRTIGCTTLQVDRGVVTFRRIDLRCDRPTWKDSALPHELTHAVLADRHGGQPLPLWADEGLAVLAESKPTRMARDQALLSAVRSGQTIPISTLLRLASQPASHEREAFYGQSAVLVSHLIDRKSPAAFLAFLEEAQDVGHDAALRQCYGIDGVNGLARLWSEYAKAAAPGQLVELTERAAIRPGAEIASASRHRNVATP